MSHIVINTHPGNYENMVSWYMKVFEAEIAYANDDVAFLGFDDEHHRSAIAAVPHVVKPRDKSSGLNHFAFTYEDLEQLLFSYERLKSEGIEPYWPILHGPTTSLYYKDPDLNRVELLCDNLAGNLSELSAEYRQYARVPINPVVEDFPVGEKTHQGQVAQLGTDQLQLF